MRQHFLSFSSVAILIGCAAPVIESPSTDPQSDQIIAFGAIETTADGTCIAKGAAETTTVDESVVIEVVPATLDQNGVVTSPAVFRNVTRPKTVVVSEGTRFETVCPPALTQSFVTTLQRALQTRDAYSGAVNGQYDAATGIAVQRFQRAQGIDSPYLSVATARQLGVLAVARDSL